MSAPAQTSVRTRWVHYLTRAFRRPKQPATTRSHRAEQLIAQIRERRLTYCGPPKLENVCETIERLTARNVKGCFVEAGCALGGSAILIGSLKPAAAPLYVFDVFGMIPSPTDNDGPECHVRYSEIKEGRSAGIQGDTYYGYTPNLRQVVEQNLHSFGLDLAAKQIRLIEGLFEETLHVTEPIAFAHIDCDWYDSVRVCINRLAPHIVPGGAIVFDDYSSYSGCRRAVDEWLKASPQFSLTRVKRSATVERVSR
jgi:Macrocin-O-methyltransferase (TylF)